MIKTDEDALICDFAEYYKIYDYRALPVRFAATLACGLRDNSRIKKALSGTSYDTDTLLLAAAVDRLSLLWWAKTKDGQDGVSAPASVLSLLLGEEENESDAMAFVSGDEFEKTRKNIIAG